MNMIQPESRRTCSRCSAENTATAQFCSSCGNPLTASFAPDQRGATSSPLAAPNSAPFNFQRRMTGGLQATDSLQQRYHIMRLLGRGGFGAVYEATDDRLRARRVAVKEMSYSQFDATNRAIAIKNFESEANMLASLHHPNFPQVSDFFEEDGKAYIVMDYVDGKTLQKVLDEVNGPLDEARVLHWAYQLCEVLGYLHKRNIIFRDLKPSNVMVTQDAESGNEQIKLIDFGIARIFKGGANRDTHVIISRNFAPPEQFGIEIGVESKKQQTDPRSDIYALGATLYALLTNTLPADALARLGNATALERPRRFNPQLSKNTENVILKALEMNPDARFQAIGEMEQALQLSRAIPQPGTAPQPPGDVPSDPDRRKLLKRVAIGAGVLAGVAIVGGGGYALTHTGGSTGPAVTSGPITLDLAFSTEKYAWMRPLIDKFNKQGKLGSHSITINILDSGSIDVSNKILDQSYKPVVYSPASSLETFRLNANWQSKYNHELIPTSGDDVPVSLLSSPLIFAVWSERANALRAHFQNTLDWSTLHDAMQKEWSTLGGDKNWGIVKFGQTLPTRSNSGLLTITLLAYAALKKENGLANDDVKSQTFKNYLDVFERAVFNFGQSSGTYLNTFIVSRGPAQADIISTYENLVLSNNLQRTANMRWQQSLQIYYPSLNILSDHPFAILQAPWVTENQKAAARQFRDFLLKDEQQRLAVQNGFRPGPTNTNMQITDTQIAKNPFSLLASLSPNHSISQTIEPLAQVPDGTVINDLLSVWQSAYPSPQLANG